MRTFGSLSASASVIKRLDETEVTNLLNALTAVPEARRNGDDQMIMSGSLFV